MPVKLLAAFIIPSKMIARLNSEISSVDKHIKYGKTDGLLN